LAGTTKGVTLDARHFTTRSGHPVKLQRSGFLLTVTAQA